MRWIGMRPFACWKRHWTRLASVSTIRGTFATRTCTSPAWRDRCAHHAAKPAAEPVTPKHARAVRNHENEAEDQRVIDVTQTLRYLYSAWSCWQWRTPLEQQRQKGHNLIPQQLPGRLAAKSRPRPRAIAPLEGERRDQAPPGHCKALGCRWRGSWPSRVTLAGARPH